MTVLPINPNISDDSDEMEGSLPPEEDVYRRKYQLLHERCDVLLQDNERTINRIRQVRKLIKKHQKDIKLLIERLDMHGDPFRTASSEVDMKPEGLVKTFVIPKIEKSSTTDKSNSGNSGNKRTATKRKAKGEKAEKDPNAPKKPCNAFFHFCQEQRPVVVAESNADNGIGELSKQEVTKELASRWRGLSPEDKKVYVAMFERSREKYVEEVAAYVKKEQFQT